MKPIYFLALILLAIDSNAQPPNDPIPEHETFTLQSKQVGELRTMNVWTPPEYKTSTDSFSVLYMLDGGIQEDFPHIANTLGDLIHAKKIPPIILVGIENTQRRKDLTGETNVKKDKEIAPVVGGAEAFRAFIRDELMAEITKRYRTRNHKGIIGESLAGLFVTETFLLKPDFFDFYIAFDPSLWWNDESLVKAANKHLDSFPTTQKTLWFASSSAKSIFKPTRKLAAALQEKNIKNLHWEYSRERKEKHNTIFRATKEKALIWSLGKKAE
jgi:predicted alpha/beta superfamily hydrolase